MFHTPVHKLSRLDLIELRAEQRARQRELEAAQARKRIEAYYAEQDAREACPPRNELYAA